MKFLKFLYKNLLLFSAFFLISIFLYPKTIFADNTVVINEIMANPNTGENEWIELYNKSSSDFNASGWTLEEKTSGGNTITHNLPNFTITATNFWVYDFSTNSLNNDGDTVTIKDNTGNTVDYYQFGQTTQGKTFGRVPDGGENWVANLDPTKNSSNGAPSPTPSSSSTPTPSPEPTSTDNSSPYFTISSNTTSTTSNDNFPVTVVFLEPNSPGKDFYVEGAFTQPGHTNYCGFTSVSNNWINYSEDYNKQLLVQTDDSGKWGAFNINVKFNSNDNGCKNSGDYTFKVRRFNSTGSDYVWSDNTITIAVTVVPASTSTPTPTPTSKASPTATSKPTPTNSPTPSPKISSQSGEILGTNSALLDSSSQPTDKTFVSDEKSSSGNKWIYFGVGFLVLSIGGAFILKLKRKKNEIPHKLSF